MVERNVNNKSEVEVLEIVTYSNTEVTNADAK